MVYHLLAKFGGHRCFSSRDIIFLVCQMIKQDHIIKESSDNDRGTHLKISHHSTKFVGHRHCGSGDIIIILTNKTVLT